MTLPDYTPDFLPAISAGVGGASLVATIALANKFALSEWTAAIGVILSIGIGIGVAIAIGCCYVRQHRTILL